MEGMDGMEGIDGPEGMDGMTEPGSAGSAAQTRRGGAGRPGARLIWGLALLGGAALVGLGAYGLVRADAVVWLARANQWIADTLIARLGYGGVFAAMLIESSFVPFPSEIIIPPAGDLARRLPDWSLGGVIGAGVLGSLAGAVINYALALYLGRPLLIRLIRRFGGYFRITMAGYEHAELVFNRHGAVSTFTGRLIPGIRQIISLPAGLARMNLVVFCALTALGAGMWVVVLALVGYWFGSDPHALSATLKTYSHWVVGGAVLLLAGYAGWMAWRRRRA